MSNKISLESTISSIYRSKHKMGLKHDITCRKISQSIGADSVSILLYKGALNQLKCRGRYIDPRPSKSNAKPLDNEEAQLVLQAMKTVDIWEFFKMRNCKATADMFKDYYNNICCSKTVTEGKFIEITENASKIIDAYKKYKHCFLLEEHPVTLSGSISGHYYYIIHNFLSKHLSSLEFKTFFENGGGKIFSDTKVGISNLYNKPLVIGACRKNLEDLLNIRLKPGGFYIGIPIQAPNSRYIGVMRIILGERIINSIVKSKYPEIQNNNIDAVINRSIEVVHEYLITDLNFLNIADQIGVELNNHELYKAFRKISLKKNLNIGINDNPNYLANDLAEVVNCYGSIIRTSKGFNEAKISGYSNSVSDYVKEIGSSFDPYIKDGVFHNAFIDIFYNSNKLIESKSSKEIIDISCIKINIFENRYNIEYFFINENEKEVTLQRKVKFGSKLSFLEKELRQILLKSIVNFNKFDIKEVIILPIKEIEYGLITLANKSVQSFNKSDIEMIISVTKRLGLELKHTQDSEQIKSKEQSQAFANTTEVILHQIGVPINSVKWSIENILSLYEKYFINSKPDKIEKLHSSTKSTYDLNKTVLKSRLNRIHQQFEMMTRHLRSIHRFFEWEKGELEIKPGIQKYDLERYLIRKKMIFIPQAKDKEIDIFITKDENNKEYEFNKDPDIMDEIMHCLLDNAIKYSFEQKDIAQLNETFLKQGLKIVPTPITIKMSRRNNRTLISISNVGCEIPKEDRKKIFEKHYRSPVAENFSPNGNGIGLFFVKQLIEAYDGTISVDHQNYRTVFTIGFKD